jgi:hypothetical protein
MVAFIPEWDGECECLYGLRSLFAGEFWVTIAGKEKATLLLGYWLFSEL